LKGIVNAVCRSLQRGKPKEQVRCGFFREHWGLIGDAHAGTAKEVSLLLKSQVEILARETGMVFPPGAFAENLLVSGLLQEDMIAGGHLQIGSVTLQIEKIGKDPGEVHSYHYYGYSLLPRFGVFAQVLRGGWVLAGDAIELLEGESHEFRDKA
jgi:molybdopterin adenylyltransferase